MILACESKKRHVFNITHILHWLSSVLCPNFNDISVITDYRDSGSWYQSPGTGLTLKELLSVESDRVREGRCVLGPSKKEDWIRHRVPTWDGGFWLWSCCLHTPRLMGDSLNYRVALSASLSLPKRLWGIEKLMRSWERFCRHQMNVKPWNSDRRA